MKHALTLILGLVILAPVGAWARPGGPHGMAGPRLERALAELDLDAGSWEQIDAILDAAAFEGDALREEIHVAHIEMRARMDADSPDLGAILSQAETIGLLKTEAHKQRLETWFAIRAVLTESQLEQLAQLRHERRSHAKLRRENFAPDAGAGGPDRLE